MSGSYCVGDFSGEVFNEATASTGGASCDNSASLNSGVAVTWHNLNNGAQGEAELIWDSSGTGNLPANFAFQMSGSGGPSSCWLTWKAIDIPFSWGKNRIVFTAAGDSGRSAQTAWEVTRMDRVEELGFKLKLEGDRIELSWNDNAAIDSYNFYYSKTHHRNDPSTKKIADASSPVILDALDHDEVYTFWLFDVRDGKENRHGARLKARPGWHQTHWAGASTAAGISLDFQDMVHIHSQSDSNGGNYRTGNAIGWQDNPIGNPGGDTAAIAVDFNQVTHLVYAENNALVYAYLDNAGWITHLVETERNLLDPRIAIDSNGHVHLAYYADDRAMYASNASGDWETQVLDNRKTVFEIDENNGGANLTWPLIAIDVDYADRVHIAYVSGGYGSFDYSTHTSTYHFYKLNHATLTSGNWTHEEVDLFSSWLSDPVNMDMSLDREGYLHLVFQVALPNREGPRHSLTYLTNRSGNWTRSTIYNSGYFNWPSKWSAHNFAMAVDSQGFVHLAAIVDGGEIVYDSNSDGVWNLYESVIVNNALSSTIDIAMNTSDGVHIVYSGRTETRHLANLR